VEALLFIATIVVLAILMRWSFRADPERQRRAAMTSNRKFSSGE
jgi:hypothetical protein